MSYILDHQGFQDYGNFWSAIGDKALRKHFGPFSGEKTSHCNSGLFLKVKRRLEKDKNGKLWWFSYEIRKLQNCFSSAVFYNQIDGAPLFRDLMAPFKIDNDGVMFFSQSKRASFLCPLDASYFPFDEHMCNLKLGPWTYDVTKVDVNGNIYFPVGKFGRQGTFSAD